MPHRIHRAVGGQRADDLRFSRWLNNDRGAAGRPVGERERVTDATAKRGCVAQRARASRPRARRSRGRTAASRASSLRSSPESTLDPAIRSARCGTYHWNAEHSSRLTVHLKVRRRHRVRSAGPPVASAGLPYRRRLRRSFMQPGAAISIASRRFASVAASRSRCRRAPSREVSLTGRPLARTTPPPTGLACSSLSVPGHPAIR